MNPITVTAGRTTLPRAIERLMVLDAVLADRDRTWLATDDKVSYFPLTHRIPRQDLPSLTFHAEHAETVRYFPEKLPIALDPDGRTHLFLYLVTQDVPTNFRAFLERHAELLRALPAWTVRLLLPRHKTDALPLYTAAFREQVASPLRPSLVEDVRWLFHARRQPPRGPHERFDQAVRALARRAFRRLYRAWLERGDPVLDAAMSATLADALARKTRVSEAVRRRAPRRRRPSRKRDKAARATSG